jgi:NADH-quinone oxidoreductase subunit N
MKEIILTVLPELVIATGIIIVSILTVLKKENKHILIVTALVILLAQIVLTLYSFDNTLLFHSIFKVDSLSQGSKSIILLGTLLWIIFSKYHIISEGRNEYNIFILITTLGGMLVSSSNNWLIIFASLELQTMPLYVMAAFKKDDAYASEAGVKYFIVGSLTTGIISFAISKMYGYTAILDISEIKMLLWTYKDSFHLVPKGLLMSYTMVLTGLLIKLGVAPFHAWINDVYQGSPIKSTSYFILIPKIAVLTLFVRIFWSIGGGSYSYEYNYTLFNYIRPALLFLSITSVGIGTWGALEQMNIKRFFGYSAISSMGFILMGISLGHYEGLHGSMLYLIIYIIGSLLTLGVVLSLKDKNGVSINYFYSIKGLSKNNKLVSYILAISLFSIAGIPPLIGFLGKFWLFLATLLSNNYLLFSINLILSVVTSAIYVRIIKLILFDTKNKYTVNEITFSMSNIQAYILSFLFLITVSFFLYPHTLIEYTYELSLTQISNYRYIL